MPVQGLRPLAKGHEWSVRRRVLLPLRTFNVNDVAIIWNAPMAWVSGAIAQKEKKK